MTSTRTPRKRPRQNVPPVRVFNEVEAPIRTPELERFGQRVLTRMKARGQASVAIVDDERIRKLNRQHRRIDETTDVLSFPYEPIPGEKGRSPRYLGDIAISWPEACRNADKLGMAAGKEIRRLLLHGLLHLLGYDHETDTGQMLELENRIQAEMGL